MDWIIERDALPRQNVRGCLSHAYSQIQAHIDQFGRDDQLPTDPHYLSEIFLNVRFGIARKTLQSTLTYSDALPILEALWLKGSEEGEYRSALVHILSRKNGEYIGDAVLWKYPKVQSQRGPSLRIS